VLYLLDGTELRTRSAIVATGAAYRRLDVPGVEALTGRGVYYGAAMAEAASYRDRDVFVVGGANSAGQAALHLAQFARSVSLVVRGDRLGTSMSAYLVDQIVATPNIQVELSTQIMRVEGDARLETVLLTSTTVGEHRVRADALFVMIGQQPATAWAAGGLALDSEGFVLTGRNLPICASTAETQRHARQAPADRWRAPGRAVSAVPRQVPFEPLPRAPPPAGARGESSRVRAAG
jgi:thioredoxin reductase (NADPH)